jgi:hypothetical protein
VKISPKKKETKLQELFIHEKARLRVIIKRLNLLLWVSATPGWSVPSYLPF